MLLEAPLRRLQRELEPPQLAREDLFVRFTRPRRPGRGPAAGPDHADPATEGVVLIGEIGGTDEQEAAEYVKHHVDVPVVGFIAGQTAPPGRTMGHAGAIVSGGSGTAAAKIEAMEAAGINVCRDLGTLGRLCKEVYE